MPRNVALAALALFVVSIPSENGVAIGGLGSLSKLLGLLAFGCAVLALFDRGRLRVRVPSPFVVIAALLALYGLASYLWSWVPWATLSTAVTLAQLFVLTWLVWELCRSERETAVLLQAFVAGCYVMAGVGLYTFLGSAGAGFRNVGNFNPNEFSIILAIGIPMAWRLSLYWRQPLLVWLNTIYPLFAIAGVVLAASRGGLLTTLVALSVVPLGMRQLSPVRRLLLFGLITLATWVAFVQAPTFYPELERNLERLGSAGEELSSGTLTGRTRIWQAGVSLFREAPINGIGFGAFPYAVEPILGEVKAPHNAFLSMAVGGGLIGLSLFIALLAAVFLSIVQVEDSAKPFCLILFAALLVGMLPSNAETDKYAWFVLALLSAQRPFLLVQAQRPWRQPRTPLVPAGAGRSKP